MELLIYLLKVTGCTAALYIVYYTLLRKLTFFSLNRWYLLSALAVSLIIPALHIGIQTLMPAPPVIPITINASTKTILDVADPIITQPPAAHINWIYVATCTYWLIAGLFLLKLTVSLCRIFYKATKYGHNQNGYRLINRRSPNNSSFFKYIFLNDNDLNTGEKEQVIAHELMHVKRLHSADNLFTEVLKALLWFDPFIYLFARALHQVHEFEVDSCLANRYNSKNYAGLLLKLSSPGTVGLVNRFSGYGLKSRIGMLFSKPSATAKKLIYLLVLPVVLALVYFLSVEKVYAYDVNNKNFILVLDAGHGGKQTGINAGGVWEKDLNLTMVKQIKAIAEQRGIKTILTRTDDSDVPLKNRLIPQGDIFVSVHVNGTSAPYTDASGMAVLTNKNANYARSQQLAQAFISEMKHLSGLGISDDANNNQGILVLRENKVPAILLELGYMNNKNDLKFLLNKQNQYDIAERFVDAVIKYKRLAVLKASGAIIHTDSTTKANSKLGFTNTKPLQKAIKTDLADTTIKSKAKATSTTAKSNGKIRSMTISYPPNDPTNKDEHSLSDDFKQLRYTAKDSSRADNATKTLYLYGDATAITSRFNISARSIKISRKDSTLCANGNVHVKFTNNKDPKDNALVEGDVVNIDFKYRLKK